MPKYQWEAKPPITRPDLFEDGTEIGSFHAESDEKAIAWGERTFKKHDIGQAQTIRILSGNRVVRTIKSGPRETA